jgi:hypothetical protein
MTSAHRSPESAHRSADPELHTEVFFVKVEDKDAVIVSFVDEETQENEGIFLYEPGAEPLELTTAGVSGVANEFEFATVSAVTTNGTEVEWPGDGMVTRAKQDAAVEAATEDLANLQQAYDGVLAYAQRVYSGAEKRHQASHGGAFRYCTDPMCREVQFDVPSEVVAS